MAEGRNMPTSREYGENQPFGADGMGPAGEDMLDMAHDMDARGELLPALYLYLASYERIGSGEQGQMAGDGHPAVAGLRRAFEIASTLGDHNLAAHVLELLEPHLNLQELATAGRQLEDGMGLHIGTPDAAASELRDIANRITREFIEAAGINATVEDDLNSEDDDLSEDQGGELEKAHDPEPIGPGSCLLEDLVGYGNEVARLYEGTYLLSADDGDFVRQMAMQHGIDSLPPQPPLLFQGPVREDTNRLMLAAAAELKATTLRLRVDENPLAGAVLCVIASNGFDPRRSITVNGFNFPKVLVLEDVDTWAIPQSPHGAYYGEEPEMQAAFTRGAYQAMSYIRMAIANPSVTVFASMSSDPDDDGWVEILLGEVEPFEVGLPDASERDEIWTHLMERHTSLSPLDTFELVQLTQNMCRCDIMDAAHEAVEQAFAQSIKSREYVPVTRSNILEKIAAYQPLGSREYQQIEDSVVEGFLREIEMLEDIDGLDG